MTHPQGTRRGIGRYVRKAVLAVIVVITGVVIAIGLSNEISDRRSGDEAVETAATPTPAATQTVETPTPTPLPIPVLENDYEDGAVLRVYGTYFPCTTGEGEYAQNCYPHYHLFQGDVVQIMGPPTIMNRDEEWGREGSWHWPIKILQGGVYVEGEWLWISDSAYLYETSLGERPVPDFEVGDKVRLNYNFVLAGAPAGQPVGFDAAGNPLLVYGGTKATVTGGPTLTSDGYYSCEIEMSYRPTGWVPCEFKLAPEW